MALAERGQSGAGARIGICMSDQTDALNKLARDRGVPVPDSPVPALPGLEEDAARPDLPWIQLPGDGVQMRPFSQKIGAVIGANGVFRRELVPVTVDPETGRIEDMDAERLQTYVENQLVTFKFISLGKNGLSKQPSTMKVGDARACLRSDAFRYPLRKLQRVNFTRQPVMRADGKIELLPSRYDAESNIFTNKIGLIEYDEDWTLERAMCFWKDFYKEFPLVDGFEGRSMSVHMTAMLAIFGAALLPMHAKRLNFLYKGNNVSTGKTLMAQSAIVGPCGPVNVQAIPDSKEEFKKILDTEALNGSAYIFLDEVERKLTNRTLNAFMTAVLWTGRLMNSQKKFSVPQNAIIFLTGNNVELSGDLARRCLIVDLYAQEADAQSRKIVNVIDEAYLARNEVRADLLAALWALVRNWDKVGRPVPASVYRGFETFSNIFGGIAQAAGFANPMQSTAAEIDPDFADMSAVINELARRQDFQQDGKIIVEFREIIEVCRRLNAFEWHLEGKITKVKVKEIDHTEDPPEEYEVEREQFELTAANKSWFGRMLSLQYGGTTWLLADGRTRVRFGKRGEKRSRQYTLQVI